MRDLDKMAKKWGSIQQDQFVFDDILSSIKQTEKKRKVFGESAVKIPEVKWGDVGGLATAKEEIL